MRAVHYIASTVSINNYLKPTQYTHMYAHTHVHTNTTHAHTHNNTHMHTHTHTYTHTHTHTQLALTTLQQTHILLFDGITLMHTVQVPILPDMIREQTEQFHVLLTFGEQCRSCSDNISKRGYGGYDTDDGQLVKN